MSREKNEFPLRGRLGELKITTTRFAEMLGTSRVRAKAILDYKSACDAREIEIACEALRIKAEDIPRYFFLNVTNNGEGVTANA